MRQIHFGQTGNPRPAQTDKRMAFCNSLITQKIEASIKTLEKVVRRSDAWEKAMQQAYASLTRLDENQLKNVTALRALEWPVRP